MSKWQPMAPAKSQPIHPTRRRKLERWATSQGFSEAAVTTQIEMAESAETWMNNVYVATVHDVDYVGEGWPQMKQLSIRRIDRKVIHDWRDLQQVKNDIFGPETEAVELYPSDDRVVDTANSYHLWVLTDPGTKFPFGWGTGLRTDDVVAGIPDQQRPGAFTEAE